MTIRAEISSDTIATSCGIEIKSPSPVLSLCRRLIAEGCDPVTPMQAFRGDTSCLTVRSLEVAAMLEVNSEANGFRARKMPGPATPVRLTQPSSMAA